MTLRAYTALVAILLGTSTGSFAEDQHSTGVNAARSESASWPNGRYHELDALPDWGGIWFMEASRGDGGTVEEPKLKGEYLATREAWREEVRANDGVATRNRSNCSPPGMPRIMQMAQYPYEFLFTPGRVTINQEAWMQTRTIWTDGRGHPDDPDPTFHGHSIGYWEGDTLVVDTIAIEGRLMFTRSGAFHSPEFRITERISLSQENPDILVNEMRFTDPQALEEPYSVTVRYRRDRESTLIEFQCAENDRNPVNADGETEFH